MAAPEGNKFATKLKDAQTRKEAFTQYCDHLATGYPKEAFFFDHASESVCWKTMERYIAENPEEFPPILIERAKAKRFKHWIDEGKSLMTGKYKRGSPIIWQTCMRNLFKAEGWDREEISQNNKSHVEQLAQSIRKNSNEAFDPTD